jgi:hypothetical protein
METIVSQNKKRQTTGNKTDDEHKTMHQQRQKHPANGSI